MNGTAKITRSHLERVALIYVRQSTVAQVREHAESTMRQYDLARTAVELGWPAEQVTVIDADLGLSGRSAAGRSGFQQVVARVCLGEIGAIVGLEASRLARSSADFARLLEIARLSDTLPPARTPHHRRTLVRPMGPGDRDRLSRTDRYIPADQVHSNIHHFRRGSMKAASRSFRRCRYIAEKPLLTCGPS